MAIFKELLIVKNQFKANIYVICKKRKINKIHLLFYKLFLLLLKYFLVELMIAMNVRNINNFYSEINLVIKGNGNQSLLSSRFDKEPYEVLVNGVSKRNLCKNTCILEEDTNNISLIFDMEIDFCDFMFFKCRNIIYMDLSNFNASKVKSMNYMLAGCTNLELINFGNIDTSSVENMSSLFYYCSELKLIDLSNFNTSKVKTMEWMFGYCIKLETINFGNIDTSSLENMEALFYFCSNLTSIDLSNFNTSKVKTMEWMFGYSMNLELINFGNIDTSSVENMGALFYNCSKLKLIDLSNFNTSKVKTMEWMFGYCINLDNIYFGNIDTSSVENINLLFYNCSKLKSIDLSNFNTSKVKTMECMFGYCKNLENIYFGNIDTSSVENMKALFYNCSNLISINLLNFNTSKVKTMELMFAYCSNLKYLDLSNFDFLNVNNMNAIFYSCNSLIFLNLISFHKSDLISYLKIFRYLPLNSISCINDEYTQNYLSEINRVSNCSDECFKKNIKIDIINNTCIESCIINGYHYELNNICYTKCPDNSYLKYCDREDCINKDVKECFDITPEGYYLDINSETYKKCYNNCKFCYGEGNKKINNCKKCIDNFIFINEILYKTNCFPRCNNYYYFDEYNEYQCTEICQGKYNKLIKEKNKCIDECKNDDTYKHEYNNTCYTYDKKLQIIKSENSDIMIKETIFSYTQELLILNNTKNDIDLDIQDKVQKKIKDLVKYELDIITVNDGNDITINIGSVNYTITTTNNQKNNDNHNVSTINLGECEKELKEKYNISKNDSLYILKVDLIIEKIHRVEYEVYYPFLANNLTQLNLSVCKDIKIDILIPFEIPNGQIDKYNKSSELYNSICITSTSEDGADEPYKDRQNNYKKNNSLKVCEEDCEFNDYDINNQRALCSCFTKIKLPTISEIKINEEKMFYNFKNIKNIANFKLLECVFLFLNKKNIFKNSSNYMMILLSTLSVISLFSFICYNSIKIKNNINQFSKNIISRRKHTTLTNIKL